MEYWRKNTTELADWRGGLREALARYRPQIEQYEAYASELSIEPASLALAWLCHQPGVTAPIVGPRTLEQLIETLPVIGINLGQEVLSKLDDIFPGYRPAPEAYAW